MNNQTKKFFIYTRKSTDDKDRQVRSFSHQLAELKSLALKEQLEVVDVFVEKQTAKIPGRPVFNEMIERMEKGEASGILAWHPDRLARNSVDGGKIIYIVDTGIIVEMKFPTFWFDPTPQGKFMLSIAFSQSKYYVDNLSENIKRGHRNKVKEGIWPQMSPLGYVNKNKRILPDENIAPLIKKTFEAYATGNFTLREVRDKFNALGLKRKSGKELAVSNYQKLIKNHIYIADFSVVESVGVSLLPKLKKVITICGVPNGKILANKNILARKSSLPKYKRKSKKFLCQTIGLNGCWRKTKKINWGKPNRLRFLRTTQKPIFLFWIQKLRS